MTVLGFTDENTCCDRCGKMNLKGTFVIEDADRTIFLGSDCVKKAYQMTDKEVTAKVSEATKGQRELAQTEFTLLSTDIKNKIETFKVNHRGQRLPAFPEYVSLCKELDSIKNNIISKYPLVTWL